MVDIKPLVVFIVFICSTYTIQPSGNDESPEHINTPPVRVRPVKNQCILQINELSIGEFNQNGEAHGQFIETRLFCPRGAKIPKSKTLTGYSIVIVELGSIPMWKGAIILDKEILQIVLDETSAESYYMHVVGAPEVINVIKLWDRDMFNKELWRTVMKGDNLPINMLPPESLNPVAVLLVYSSEKQEEVTYAIGTGFIGGDPSTILYPAFVLPDFYDGIQNAVKGNIVDYVVYGKAPTKEAEDFLSKILLIKHYNLGHHFLTSPFHLTHTTYSRCNDYGQSAMAYQFLPASALALNPCSNFDIPFSFKGKSLQTTAQQFALNVLAYFEWKENTYGALIEGSAANAAATALGITTKTLAKLSNNMATCSIKTPGKHRPQKPWKQQQIDSFDREKIRSIIAIFYRDNISPLFDEIFTKFMEYKKDNCVRFTTSPAGAAPSRWLPICATPVQQENVEAMSEDCSVTEHLSHAGESSPDESRVHVVEIHPEFHCSKKTFAKVVREMGFCYGRIDKRLALLQRFDIVKKRGHFLKVLKQNEESENPMKVTYLDETWIDPNNKANKGWTLKKPRTIRECKKYSYGRLKQGRGERIIALAAASEEDGIIPSSVSVYRVTKNANALDYHENINKETFMMWIENLMDEFDRRQEKHIIVIDNASYHSTLRTPRQHERKEKLLEWLRRVKNNPTYKVQVPLSNAMRKWELWDLIQKLKVNPDIAAEVYELDAIAIARGHKILRLPPYQCCFNPIEFLWNVAKRHIANQNIRQNIDEMIKIATDILRNFETNKWKGFVRHCKSLREKYWEEDGWMEVDIPDVIIPLNNDDAEDSCDDYQGCGDDDCDDCTATEDDDLFDPEEIQAAWREEAEAVRQFHAQPDPVYGATIPPVRPRRLYCDEEYEEME